MKLHFPSSKPSQGRLHHTSLRTDGSKEHKLDLLGPQPHSSIAPYLLRPNYLSPEVTYVKEHDKIQ